MPFVGRKLRLKILEVNRKANRLILSEKVALYEERREKRDELFSSLQVGQKVTGTVRSIAPFGVFIDLGGIDGLVHKSELSWNKVNNPESGYQVGEEVEAEVIDINHERGRISLSIRRLQPDPWHSTVADFKVGDVIDGTVTKLVNFGAFVRVRDGLEGLIHISELSHQRVAHPGDVVHEGQSLKLKIISLDSERHRLGLSLKQAEEPPARPVVEAGAPGAASAPGAPRAERRPRPERSYSMSDAVQEPEGGIDNTLASAFAQVRQQLAAAEVDEVVETVAEDEAIEEAFAADKVAASSRRSPRTRRSRRPSRPTRSRPSSRRVAEDESVEERGAATETIEAIVETTVDADEAALEAAAAAEIDRLADAAAAERGERDNAPQPTRRRRRREASPTPEAAEEDEPRAETDRGGRRDRRRGRGDRGCLRRRQGRGRRRDGRRGRGGRGGHRGRDVETVVETVAEDEAAEETAADETIETIAEKHHGSEHRGLIPSRRPTDDPPDPAGRWDSLPGPDASGRQVRTF